MKKLFILAACFYTLSTLGIDNKQILSGSLIAGAYVVPAVSGSITNAMSSDVKKTNTASKPFLRYLTALPGCALLTFGKEYLPAYAQIDLSKNSSVAYAKLFGALCVAQLTCEGLVRVFEPQPTKKTNAELALSSFGRSLVSSALGILALMGAQKLTAK